MYFLARKKKVFNKYKIGQNDSSHVTLALYELRYMGSARCQMPSDQFILLPSRGRKALKRRSWLELAWC